MSELLEEKTSKNDPKLNKMFVDVGLCSIEGLAFGLALSILVKNKIRMITIGSGIFGGFAYRENNGGFLFNRKIDQHITKRREKAFWAKQYEERKIQFNKLKGIN